MAFPIFGAITIFACWKWGDWRNWRKYYPTVLYMMVGDLVSDFLLSDHPLFAFGDFVEKHPILDIAVMLSIYPSTVILFLSFLPKNLLRQGLHMLVWSLIYVVVEIIAKNTGGFCYHNGWNIWRCLTWRCSPCWRCTTKGLCSCGRFRRRCVSRCFGGFGCRW